jgi:hypothetical protein
MSGMKVGLMDPPLYCRYYPSGLIQRISHGTGGGCRNAPPSPPASAVA